MSSINTLTREATPPGQLRKWIERKGVMADLDKASGRAISITAPSGYGKTVSAAQWVNERRKSAVWLAARGCDDAPAIFYRRFCETLMKGRPQSDALRDLLPSAGFALSPVEYAREAVLKMRSEEAGSCRELIIVADDLQNITNPEILKSFPRFLKTLPGNFITVLISQDGFAKEALPAGLGVIGKKALKFSLEEVVECFKGFGRNLRYLDARLVKSVSEGWPVAVHAIASSGTLPDRRAKEEVLERYFEELWKSLDADARSFLLTVCALDDLNEGLCSRVTGSDCAGMFESLVSGNAMFYKTGEGEYACCPLFMSFIRKKRRARNGAGMEKILLAASEYCFESGDVPRAIYYGFKGDGEKSMAPPLRGLAKYIPGGLSHEGRMKAALSLLGGRLPMSLGCIGDSPYHLIYSAWRFFLSGDADGVKESAKTIAWALPEMEAFRPEYARPAIMACFLDPEMSLDGFASVYGGKASALPGGRFLPIEAIASAFPFLHRGTRDFSGLELKRLASPLLSEVFSRMPGDDFAVIKSCIAGGILYEKNELDRALECAARTCGALSRAGAPPCAPELVFSAMMLKAAILDAMEDESRAGACRDEIRGYIAREGALHLLPGFRAYATKLRLQNGEKEAASEWFSDYCADESRTGLGEMTLHLTTARAMMAECHPEEARAFINRLISLARSFKRQLDEAELLILLGILEWHRGTRKNAGRPVEEAVLMLKEFGLIRSVADEGTAVLPMINKLLTV